MNQPFTFPTHREYSQQRGVAAVELAFILPMLLLIFAGIAEFGRAFWYYDALAKATRDGARIMSTQPLSIINTTAGSNQVKDAVATAANAAGINPGLARGQVLITCLDAALSPVGCTPGTAPANMEVAISGYTINIGSSIPFIVTAGTVNRYTNIPLAPHTTMRYMK